MEINSFLIFHSWHPEHMVDKSSKKRWTNEKFISRMLTTETAFYTQTTAKCRERKQKRFICVTGTWLNFNRRVRCEIKYSATRLVWTWFFLMGEFFRLLCVNAAVVDENLLNCEETATRYFQLAHDDRNTTCTRNGTSSSDLWESKMLLNDVTFRDFGNNDAIWCRNLSRLSILS